MICHQRYQNTIKEYDKQFAYELEMQESMQFNAYNAMRFHRYFQLNILFETILKMFCELCVFRHFVITTLWPPLHTRKEIDYTLNKMFKLTKKQDKRLKEILSGPVY